MVKAAMLCESEFRRRFLRWCILRGLSELRYPQRKPKRSGSGRLVDGEKKKSWKKQGEGDFILEGGGRVKVWKSPGSQDEIRLGDEIMVDCGIDTSETILPPSYKQKTSCVSLILRYSIPSGVDACFKVPACFCSIVYLLVTT